MNSPTEDGPSNGTVDRSLESAPVQPEIRGFQEHIDRQLEQIREFKDHIDSQLEQPGHDGIDGYHNTVKFVCRNTLIKYWTSERINDVLPRDQRNEVNVEDFRKTYLHTFSILCYISSAHRINHFMKKEYTDATIPFSLSGMDREVPGDAEFWQRFHTIKWMFWPLTFDPLVHRRDLLLEQILPIYDRKFLWESSSGDSVVHKVRVHRCCGDLKVDSNEIVLKTLQPEAKDLWENESKIYYQLFDESGVPLGNSDPTAPLHAVIVGPFDYITRYLGSFTQPLARRDEQQSSSPMDPNNSLAAEREAEKIRTIVLEYASGGNLAHFCQRNADVIASRRRVDELNLTHQDLKESNILYTRRPLTDRDNPCFKISDLGTANSGDEKNNSGNKSNTPPECCSIHPIQIGKPPRYTKAADIWQLGGYELGFHSGWKRLKCVDDFHREAVQDCPPESIPRFVSDLILEAMLVPKEDRETEVLTLRTRWLNRPKAGVPAVSPAVENPVPAQNQPPPPPASNHHGQPMSILPQGVEQNSNSVEEIATYLRKHRRIGPKAFQDLQYRLNIMGRRRHRILIDESSSMAQFQTQVAQTARVLAKLVKHRMVRGTRVEVSLPKAPSRPMVFPKSKQMEKFLQLYKFKGEKWELGILLNETARDLLDTMSPPQPPINLYILTDGIFGEPPPDLVRPIRDLIDQAKDPPPAGSDFLSITVILFGDDQNGAWSLEQLRLAVGRMVNLPSENPIYICHCTSSVADMLIGRLQVGSVGQSLVTLPSQNVAPPHFAVPRG
ncbi:hypothetical protein B0T26DRAFT_802472 [Lasiosphaeria miniovina]|uniref:Protein kinase domain-containing protein n=1 Tax=Lasiosphaeria miniovina TaxID=1954250 RepID=A0AA40AK22_9PEZI|nr:uncharacterized protein B0T26DRAFT_802472 [Lasiosphaeria miniovina]KAK0717302.1 hypothetical protein B0T26DRAFT_802472 [Lasiosphaeria miniovina]